jgi:hypothetical protein
MTSIEIHQKNETVHDENKNNEVYLPVRICGEWILIVRDVEAMAWYAVI